MTVQQNTSSQKSPRLQFIATIALLIAFFALSAAGLYGLKESFEANQRKTAVKVIAEYSAVCEVNGMILTGARVPTCGDPGSRQTKTVDELLREAHKRK